jgi:hypothetical protein
MYAKVMSVNFPSTPTITATTTITTTTPATTTN